MKQAIFVILLLILKSASVCLGQAPAITYASTFYKSAAGAIGPHVIVATTTYDITIASNKTIILNRAIIAGLTVRGDGIIIPTNKEGNISFRIVVTTHQKDSVWYNGELEFEGIRASAPVAKAPAVNQEDDNLVMVLYLRSNKTDYVIGKEQFDQEEAQYNK